MSDCTSSTEITEKCTSLGPEDRCSSSGLCLIDNNFDIISNIACTYITFYLFHCREHLVLYRRYVKTMLKI